MENPKVSIIVPIYNVEKYLAECLESILSQTFTEYECILVDDHSPDRCPDICDEYVKKDKRIKVIHKKKNEGLPQARKTGFDESIGNYILFIDSDDWIEQKMVERLYSLAMIENCDIVHCNMDDYDGYQKNGERIPRLCFDTRNMNKDDIINNLLKYIFDCSLCNKLSKRELYKNIIFPKFQQWEDAVICIQLLLKANNIGYEYSILYHHRLNPDSLTYKNDEESIKRREIETYNNWTYIQKILFQRDDYFKYKEAIEWQLDHLEFQTPSPPKMKFSMVKLLKLVKYLMPHGIVVLYRLMKRNLSESRS